MHFECGQLCAVVSGFKTGYVYELLLIIVQKLVASEHEILYFLLAVDSEQKTVKVWIKSEVFAIGS